MNILFIWNLPQTPPSTPAEEDAYYAQFELWPGHAALSAMRRRLKQAFTSHRASPKCDHYGKAFSGASCCMIFDGSVKSHRDLVAAIQQQSFGTRTNSVKAQQSE
jgi:hypothetical protein